ncbi:hypothetical protein STIAU_4015, partial [Stigmatella aurantiaca DW4/3-1]
MRSRGEAARQRMSPTQPRNMASAKYCISGLAQEAEDGTYSMRKR